MNSEQSKLTNKKNLSYMPTFTPVSGTNLPGGSHHTRLPLRRCRAYKDDLPWGGSESASLRASQVTFCFVLFFPQVLYLLLTPLHPAYPERRHRGQVHFRGAGYYLVSRQDACREQSFSAVDHGPIMQPTMEAHSSSTSAGLRRYAPRKWMQIYHPFTFTHSPTHPLVHSGEEG